MESTWTPLALLCGLVALLNAVAVFALVILRRAALPERIPLHFGLGGVPDYWGRRQLVWMYALVSAVLLGVLVVAVVTGADRREVEAGAAIIAYSEIMMLFITLRMFAIAQKQAGGLGRMFLPVFMLGVVLIMVRYAV